ncbi:MAG: class I SAM-dependent methyltransferase [Deltaproteobacteria bacterium]|nr:class I SAM-dependent methyltransferase [Deltaproteobacteria bacterium]
MTLSTQPKIRQYPCATLCDISDFLVPRNSAYLKICKPGFTLSTKRRQWEWNFIAESAENLGLLDGTKIVMGVGTGNEPLLFFFARTCADVLGSDLYSADTDWSVARFEKHEQIYNSAPFDFPKERLHFVNADMRKLPVEDNSYDFVWSTSTIEHPASAREVYMAIQEMLRVVKPGGYVLFTTEYCVSEPPYFLPHLNTLDPYLFGKYFYNNQGFEIIGDVDLEFNWQSITNDISLRRNVPIPYYKHFDQLQFYAPQSIVQSLGFSLVVPIGMVLRKIEGKMKSWDNLGLPQVYLDYASAAEAFDEKEFNKCYSLIINYGLHNSQSLPLQFYAQLATLILRAKLEIGNPYDNEALQVYQNVIQRIPYGLHQDADLLDILAYYASGMDNKEVSSELLYLVVNSTSSIAPHAISCSLRRMEILAQLGKEEEGINFVITTYGAYLSEEKASVPFANIMQEIINKSATNPLYQKLRERLKDLLENQVKTRRQELAAFEQATNKY